MFRFLARAMVLLVAVLVMYGCSDDDPTPTAPTAPDPISVRFEGTVTRNGAATHTFTTQASGTVTATLTQFSAEEGTRIGLALGTFNGTSCQLVITKDDATKSSTITGAASVLGSLCVRIYDVGSLTQSADYEIVVAHP